MHMNYPKYKISPLECVNAFKLSKFEALHPKAKVSFYFRRCLGQFTSPAQMHWS